MDSDRYAERLQAGVKVWNQFRKKNDYSEIEISGQNFDGLNLKEVNFNGVTLENISFRKAHLEQADFANSRLKNVNFSEADLRHSDFSKCTGAKLDFGGSNLSGCDFHESQLESSNFNGAYLLGTNLQKISWREVSLRYVSADECNLTDAILKGADLYRSEFPAAIMPGARLASVDMTESDLRGANMRNADLDGTDFGGARFDENTQFGGASVARCKVDIFQLEKLSDYGGLTVGQRMEMKITDGVATLRASYSGFWQWVHLTALALFLFPYAWFLITQWSLAEFFPSDSKPHMPLWQAMLTFIYNGGENWESGPDFHLSFLCFFYLLIYNVLRGLLLWKTKALELYQESTNLPAIFSLEHTRWGWAYKVATWGFWIALAIALINTGHFLTQQIPINPS